jgi:hypothetical protein
MRPRLLPSRTFWRPNEGCGGWRGTWKLVSAPCCESRTNWRARKCGRSSLGRCSRYWPEERSDESLRRHGIIVAAARVLKITTFSLSLLVSAAVSVHGRNNRHDQHRAKRRDLELRKIFSAGCASSRLLRVASRGQCPCHRYRVLDLWNSRRHPWSRSRRSLRPPPFNQASRTLRLDLRPHLMSQMRVP